jgi:nitrogen regulatory protein PII
MHFKLIIALVDDKITDKLVQAARDAGATGVTTLNQVRGEGINTVKTFFGLELEMQRDMLMFLVEEHLSRKIIEHVAEIGKFEEHPGAGIAFQLDVEDVVGVNRQIRKLHEAVEDEL